MSDLPRSELRPASKIGAARKAGPVPAASQIRQCANK
jgi:hypothetical protein